MTSSTVTSQKQSCNVSPVDAGKTREEFTAFIDTALRYIEKWLDFSESNWLHCLPPLSLHGKLTFNDLEKICERLHLMARVNMALYDECTTLNIVMEKLRKGEQ